MKTLRRVILPVLITVLAACAAGARDLGNISNYLTIDDMTLISNWVTSKGSNDTVTLTSTATSSGASAIKMDYTFGVTDGWAQITKNVEYWKLYGTETMYFYFKKTGSTEKLYVKFKDDDGDIMKVLVGTIGDSGGWQAATLTLASFAYAPESTGPGTFSWDKVASMEFAFDKSEGGSGTLIIDDIYFSVQNLLMDDFESGSVTANLFGGSIGTYTGSGGLVYTSNVSTVAYRGGRSFEMKYDVTAPGSYSGIYMNGNGKNVSAMNQLRFWVKGAVGGEKLMVELKTQFGDVSGTGVRIFQDSVAVSTFSGITGITGTWQQVVIDLSKYTANQLGAIQSINFNFNQDLIPMTSVTGIYIDDLYFYNSNTGLSYNLVDNLDTPVANTSWATWPDGTTDPANPAKSSLSSVTGYDKGAVQMDYAFNGGTWITMTRKAAINMSYYDAVYLPSKMTGNINYIEIKLKDSSGITYIHKRTYTAAGTWGTIKAPIKDFALFSGSSGSKLNLKEIIEVQIAASKYLSTGSSSLYIGEMYLGAEAGFFNDFNQDDVMTSLDVLNNPFRVDGSGYKAFATFEINFSEAATLRFRVYNLKGIIIYESEMECARGYKAFNWDGKNNDGTTQRSGLYFYQLSATGESGRTQKFSNIVGIEK
jgi:hypothetical protein